jgi:UDP-glucose 4-epimerase
VNASGALTVLEAARTARVERFVYVSSSEVYGTAIRVPMDEHHPTMPTTVYGGSKLTGESYARAFHRSYGLPTVVVRPFNTYGPRCHHEGDSGEVIPKFVLRRLTGHPLVIFGDGQQTRDFTYVNDTARGILLAGRAPDALGETINLGTGREVSINDLARMTVVVTGDAPADVRYEASRPGDVRRLCADAKKAEALLGFTPALPLSDGLRRVRDWYLGSGRSLDELVAEEVVRNWEPVSRRG